MSSECHQTVCLDVFSTLSFRKAVAPVVAKWYVFPTTSSYCWRNARYRPVSSRHSPLIDSCGVTSVKMVLPYSTTIRRQKLAGYVATPSPHRRQPAHAATSVIESVPQISDCAVIYASTIVHPQLTSTASSSTSTDSYKQASKRSLHSIVVDGDGRLELLGKTPISGAGRWLGPIVRVLARSDLLFCRVVSDYHVDSY